MRSSDRAWLTLATGVLAYEVRCGQGELLSQAADRYRHRHPVLTRLAIGYLAAHLLRAWPERIDPLHQLARAKR